MSADEAKAAIDCLRVDPTATDLGVRAERLGIIAAGVQYSGFRKLFQVAYGDELDQCPTPSSSAACRCPRATTPR